MTETIKNEVWHQINEKRVVSEIIVSELIPLAELEREFCPHKFELVNQREDGKVIYRILI